MRNMYEQSFDYLATSIVNYFTEIPPGEGGRFHVQFEKINDVEALFNALNSNANSQFQYGGYQTGVLQVGGSEIIIASSHNANEHFLTKLRNRTAEQRHEFIGKALLI